ILNTSSVLGAFYSSSGPSSQNPFNSTQCNPVRTGMQTDWAGTYHVWVTTPQGCVAEDTVHVQVSPEPSATAPSSIPPVWSGTALNMSAAVPLLGHYIWTGPVSFTAQDTTIASATQAMQGTYQVTVTVNGCTSPIGLLQVTVRPSPQIQASAVTASDTLICQG